MAEVLKDASEAGTINNKVAMISVADGVGIDLVTAARPSMEEAGIEVVYDVTYPAGTTGITSMINDAGSIVITSSVVGVRGDAGVYGYITAKHTQVGLRACRPVERIVAA